MKLSEAIGATWMVMNGQTIDVNALDMIVSDLETYPIEAVMLALSRVRLECKRASLADILERIPGGHPGPEEAWALVAKALADERVSVLMTDQISEAFNVALGLSDDHVAARMAFLEAYRRIKAEAQQQRIRPRWRVSLGHDAAGRAGVMEEAVRKGFITAAHASLILPGWEQQQQQTQPVLTVVKQLTDAKRKGGSE